MKASLDGAKCTGHGLCYEFAPHVFVSNEDGLSELIGDGAVAPEREGEARMAEASCPERAITLS